MNYNEWSTEQLEAEERKIAAELKSRRQLEDGKKRKEIVRQYIGRSFMMNDKTFAHVLGLNEDEKNIDVLCIYVNPNNEPYFCGIQKYYGFSNVLDDDKVKTSIQYRFEKFEISNDVFRQLYENFIEKFNKLM